MKKLTEQQMSQIIKEGSIGKLSQSEKNQVFQYAFGKDYMESTDKGSKKTINL